MQRAAMAGAARCVGRCSALHLLPRLSAPNLLPPCPPLSMGEKSLLHGSVTSSPWDRVASCIVLWWLFCRRETHFPLGWKFSSISKSSILHGAASSSSYGRKTIGSQVFVASPTACQESGFAQEPIYIMYRRGLELCSHCIRFRLVEGWEQFLPTEQERLAGWCWAFRLPPTASHPGPRASGRAGAHGPWRGLEHRRRDRATTSGLSCQ